ncbi:response regulator transcription factor [Allohahella marinimesophila]|uniref:Response regulator transcription factor n=1 Tax=Allohahella marinimesophila TaxID=1054972 RepID=A0ABP7P0S1_9GAMM
MNIIIADDHGLFRTGLMAALEDVYPQARLYEAASGQQVWQQLEHEPEIDLLLLDLQLPDVAGLDLLGQLQQRYPLVPVAILSGDDRPETMRRALAHEIQGYICKAGPTVVVIRAIQLILAGGSYFPHSLLAARGDADSTIPIGTAGPAASLSRRQVEVLRLLAEGLRNKEICSRLSLSMGTIKTHCNSIYRDLNVRNRTEAARVAQDMSLV